MEFLTCICKLQRLRSKTVTFQALAKIAQVSTSAFHYRKVKPHIFFAPPAIQKIQKPFHNLWYKMIGQHYPPHPFSGRTSTAEPHWSCQGTGVLPDTTVAPSARARLGSVCVHLSSRPANLFWWNAEASEVLLLGNSSFSLVVRLGVCGSPSASIKNPGRDFIAVFFLAVLNTCGVMEGGFLTRDE